MESQLSSIMAPKIRIMATNEQRLEKLLSHDWESSFRPGLPKIQRVQPYLRKSNPQHYSPKLVSIGPIHHQNDDLPQQGGKYKSMWAAMYLKGICPCNGQHLYKKIEDNLPTLKGLYSEDVIKDYKDKDLSWIFFEDGCAVLYFMEKVSEIESSQELKIKVDQLLIVQQDLLLLENQLPFRVLELLTNHVEPQLFNVINKFFIMFSMIPDGVQGKENNTTGTHDSTKREEDKITVDPPTHLLHLLRNEFIEKNSHDRKTQGKRKGDKSWYTHRNLQELKATGIQVKRNKKNATRTHINFKTSLHFWGILYLSEFFVDDSTAPTLLNMIAYEMCPDFENNYEISSYAVFLDSLIDNEDDVKELRKAGILRNALGSDEEVAKLFNTISTDLVPDEEIYQDLRDQIEGHYKKKYKTWMAQAYYKKFSNPLVFLAFMAALFALFLTSVQTWFAIYPSHNG